MSTDHDFWNAQRRRIYLPKDSINLNAGTLSPTPIPVMEALMRVREMQARAPSDFLWRQTPPLMARARTRLAEYVHCNPANLLLLPNVTHAINLAVQALSLERGAEILITDHEYGAMIYTWRRWAAERGWTIREAKLPYKTEDPVEIVAAIEAAIRPSTKALFFSHVLSTTGLVLPAAELCTLARRRGLASVVDGAHAAGMVPLDLQKIDADFYGANCHKWIMAPMGAGFLSVREKHKNSLVPPVVSWGWGYPPAEREADSGCGGSKWQHALEFYGCTERCPQMVLPEVFDFRESLGGDGAIARRVREVVLYAREKISEAGFAPATPLNSALSGALVAFELPRVDPLKFREGLWNAKRIECPLNFAAGHFFLRVSAAWFVSFDEIDRLADALKTSGELLSGE
ncbi:MAG TPA: aminotransferase class V-fold PLP-dependent enzyme [Planctomycetota bacterium]|nr:aminotransferase class V-fold PLP-dependent enzyme [Planctomycetota bacterium]